MFANLLIMFSRTFWRPFLDPRRATMLIGTMAGTMGFGLLNFTSAYHFSTLGVLPLMTYLAAMFGGIAVLSALLYLAFSMIDGLAWRIAIYAGIVVAFILFLYSPAVPLIQGGVGALLSALFWGSFHVSMVQNTTSENRSYEVALSGFLTLVAGVSASLLGAMFLNRDQTTLAAVIALSTLLLGTFCMLFTSRRKPLLDWTTFRAEARLMISENRYMIRRVMVAGTYESSAFAMTAFMQLLHFSPTLVATLTISRVVIEFTLAPLIGKLSQKFSAHTYRSGLSIVLGAWIALLFFHDIEALFVPILLTNTFGQRLMGVSLQVRAYEMQSYAAMMWWELLLGLGRLAGILCLVPIMYYDVTLYCAAIIVWTLAVFALNRHWHRKFATDTVGVN